MSKDGANDLIEDHALKFPMKLEFDLTSIFSQGDKVPLSREVLKWAIYEDHINGLWAVIDIARMKVLRNTLEMNIDFGVKHRLGLLKYFHATTPRQKLRVAGNIGHQPIHAVG